MEILDLKSGILCLAYFVRVGVRYPKSIAQSATQMEHPAIEDDAHPVAKAWGAGPRRFLPNEKARSRGAINVMYSLAAERQLTTLFADAHQAHLLLDAKSVIRDRDEAGLPNERG
jgi:hypothetical protein